MVDSEYSPGYISNYISLKISIGSLIKKPEMLRVLLDHLKTKKMCKHAVEQMALCNKICSRSI